MQKDLCRSLSFKEEYSVRVCPIRWGWHIIESACLHCFCLFWYVGQQQKSVSKYHLIKWLCSYEKVGENSTLLHKSRRKKGEILRQRPDIIAIDIKTSSRGLQILVSWRNSTYESWLSTNVQNKTNSCLSRIRETATACKNKQYGTSWHRVFYGKNLYKLRCKNSKIFETTSKIRLNFFITETRASCLCECLKSLKISCIF